MCIPGSLPPDLPHCKATLPYLPHTLPYPSLYPALRITVQTTHYSPAHIRFVTCSSSLYRMITRQVLQIHNTLMEIKTKPNKLITYQSAQKLTEKCLRSQNKVDNEPAFMQKMLTEKILHYFYPLQSFEHWILIEATLGLLNLIIETINSGYG